MRTGRDWELTAFRAGAILCLVLAAILATRFDIAESVLAIQNGNPTTSALAASNAVLARTRDACTNSALHQPSEEFPSNCLYNDTILRGLPRDQAVANIQGFLICASALAILLSVVIWLGYRMIKESSRIPSKTEGD